MLKAMLRAAAVLLLVGSAHASDLIRFATEASYPPFEYLDENQEFQGFDIELVKAICSAIDRQCSFYHQPLDSLLSSVEFGRYDAAISALDITEKRLRQVAFTQAYLENQSVFLVVKDSFKNARELRDKVLAVQNGTSHQRHLIEKYAPRGNIVVPFSSYQSSIDKLRERQVDAIFIDQAVAAYWVALDPELEILADGKVELGSGLGIAVAKTNVELIEQLDQGLAILKSNGVYQQLIDSYFGNLEQD
ncbi:arginine ABC transporter substrate-binding protein [Alginatibacterium sediminis]|uniref:Arginine ABC transporter substrate-binding protein n=1 Tax=Alginatibacterium sediminis TaxID=2164068 RepID=A0A420E8L6_9ALTE|nr:transporter substrate-binding domain-containing protein [Alginatibacterium sediminis]RKF15806.1 arginine ABC transporter substrate-binding protein [Alginatibacterium sediminis]